MKNANEKRQKKISQKIERYENYLNKFISTFSVPHYQLFAFEWTDFIIQQPQKKILKKYLTSVYFTNIQFKMIIELQLK